MKVVLDEGVPEPLAAHLPGHDVYSVRQLGLKGTKNGKLLMAIEEAGFEVFITNDKKMEGEQQLEQRPSQFSYSAPATCLLSCRGLPSSGRLSISASQERC